MVYDECNVSKFIKIVLNLMESWNQSAFQIWIVATSIIPLFEFSGATRVF